MRVVVTGAAGQLGQAIVRRFAQHEVIALARQDLDLTVHDEVMRTITGVQPEVVINCSGYNAVDRAEDDAAGALAVNAFAVRSLVRAADEAGAVLVHYSTDFVFDGEATSPYTEQDEPSPRSVYGQSKLLGEYFALDTPGHSVLRVESLFGGPRPRSSVDRIIEAILEGREARVFVDRVVSPSYVDDVADATAALLDMRAAPGLYHCVNDGVATWHDVAVEIARVLERDAQLVPMRVADMPLRAPRPQYCALSNAKLSEAGYRMPTWQDAIGRYLGRKLA